MASSMGVAEVMVENCLPAFENPNAYRRNIRGNRRGDVESMDEVKAKLLQRCCKALVVVVCPVDGSGCRRKGMARLVGWWWWLVVVVVGKKKERGEGGTRMSEIMRSSRRNKYSHKMNRQDSSDRARLLVGCAE